jgi:hydroxymethylpyrimidine pyrophosphatase-like HAD family hydrolase
LSWLPRLVATDMDGTLIRTDQTASPYSHEVLQRVVDAGVPVIGVTGRGPRLRAVSAVDLPMARYLVCAQGAYVLDVRADVAISVVHLPAEVARDAIKLLEDEVGPVLVTVEAGEEEGAPLYGEAGFSWPFPGAWLEGARDLILRGELLKVFVKREGLDPDEFLAMARRVIPPELCDVTYAGMGFLEICPSGVTKAVGLAAVADRLGVAAADVLAFGDMPNDIPMLNWAGHSVAVANAHADVLAVAHEVTLSNDDDGVARYLDRLFPAPAS